MTLIQWATRRGFVICGDEVHFADEESAESFAEDATRAEIVVVVREVEECPGDCRDDSPTWAVLEINE